MEALAERTAALRQSLDGLTAEIRGELASALGEAEGGAAAPARRDRGGAAGDRMDARGGGRGRRRRLASGAAAIEAQHDRLAALLAAVDNGVGGAERGSPNWPRRSARREAEAAPAVGRDRAGAGRGAGPGARGGEPCRRARPRGDFGGHPVERRAIVRRDPRGAGDKSFANAGRDQLRRGRAGRRAARSNRRAARPSG